MKHLATKIFMPLLPLVMVVFNFSYGQKTNTIDLNNMYIQSIKEWTDAKGDIISRENYKKGKIKMALGKSNGTYLCAVNGILYASDLSSPFIWNKKTKCWESLNAKSNGGHFNIVFNTKNGTVTEDSYSIAPHLYKKDADLIGFHRVVIYKSSNNR